MGKLNSKPVLGSGVTKKNINSALDTPLPFISNSTSASADQDIINSILSTLRTVGFVDPVGPELMPDPEFDTGTTGWTAAGTATLSNPGGSIHLEQTGDATAAYAAYASAVPITSGKTYRIQAQLTTNNMAGLTSGQFGAILEQYSPGTGTVDGEFTATADGPLDLHFNLWNAVIWAPLGATADLDYLRLSEVFS